MKKSKNLFEDSIRNQPNSMITTMNTRKIENRNIENQKIQK